MAFKALKNFTGISGKDYTIGDTVKKSDVEDRLIRFRKIEEVENKPKKVESKEEKVEVEEIKEELLLDDSAKVELVEEIMADEVISHDERSILEKVFGKK